MGAQVGALSFPRGDQRLAQFFPRDVNVGPGIYRYLFRIVTMALDTTSLVEVVLWTFRIQVAIPDVNFTFNVGSSAIAPGGANISVGVRLNGVLQGGYHVHNGTALSMNRNFAMAAGDVVQIVGFTANVGVVCRIISAFGLSIKIPSISADWLGFYLEP